MEKQKIQVFAVIRWDKDIADLKDAISVKEILPTEKDAELETNRLNQLNADKKAYYFWQCTRYYPTGRGE